MGTLDAALGYLARGWSVIPVGRDKRPLIAWEEFQKRHPTKAEVQSWWAKWPKANVAIITGSISGIVVLDQDSAEADSFLRNKHLPPTPCVRTGKGLHRYFRHPGFPVRNFARRLPGLDFRGDGGYVLAPPSVHPSGRLYEWVDLLGPEVDPEPCPAWLLAVLKRESQAQAPGDDGWVRELLQGVGQGFRHDSTTRLAGYLLCRNVSPSVTLELLRAWNEMRNSPPITDEELARVVQDIARSEASKEGEPTTWVKWYQMYTNRPCGKKTWRKTSCPLCQGEMWVNVRSGKWTCINCGSGGAVHLVQKLHHCTIQKAQELFEQSWNEVAGDGLQL